MLSNVTVRTLSEALLQLYRAGTRGDFPGRLLACLKVCFLGDFYSYNERTEHCSERIKLYPASAVNLDLLRGWIDQTPDIRGVYKHSGTPGILHFWAPLHRYGSELHGELLLLLGQRHKLRAVILDERSRINVVVSRSSQSFSGEECQMLETLRPHIAQAYQSSKQRSFLSEAIGVANVGLLVTDRHGNLHYATVKARELMRRHFHLTSDLALPDCIQAWLNQGQELDSVYPLPDLTVDFGPITLTVQMMSKTGAPEFRLLLVETVRTLDAQRLEKLGLTKREAEVLFWTSQGKSNGEIAIILASKVRTIAKHLERVFAKLMVENRTAAARAALAAMTRARGAGGRPYMSTRDAASN